MGAGKGKTRRTALFSSRPKPVDVPVSPGVKVTRAGNVYAITHDPSLMSPPRFQADDLVVHSEDPTTLLRVLERNEQLLVRYANGQTVKMNLRGRIQAPGAQSQESEIKITLNKKEVITSIELEYAYGLKDEVSKERSEATDSQLQPAARHLTADPQVQQVGDGDLNRVQF